MALTITEMLRAIIPHVGLVANGDAMGTHRLTVEDVNSDEIMAAMQAVNIALQVGGISQTQFAAMVTALQLIDNPVNGTQFNVAPPILTVGPLHPFAKGPLTNNGVQYSAEVTGIGDTYIAVDAITITQPTGYTLVEVEFGLVGAVKSSSTVEGVLYKWQANDPAGTWEDLCAEQTRAADASAYADTLPITGRFAPTGQFLGAGATFGMRMFVKSAVAAGETASAKTKNSSYVMCHYRRT